MGLFVPDVGRGMGIRWVGARGSGKSTGLGRRLLVQDFDRKIAQVVLDPVGRTVDNFLDVLVRRSSQEQQRDGQRLRYVDVSGLTGYVTPMPVYHRGKFDTLFMAADRPLAVWFRMDPDLRRAPMQGRNAAKMVGRFVGMALSAMGWRLSEAESLLTNPYRFRDRLLQAGRDEPKARPAIRWLLEEMPKPGSRDWHNITDSYVNKVRDLSLEDATRATYSAGERGIDWEEVVRDGLTVLVDFRGLGEEQEDQLLFGLLWWYRSLLSFIRRRGPGRHTPLSLVIDELGFFLEEDDQQDLIAKDLRSLVQFYGRNMSVWLTVTHQELNQLSRPLANALMGMGTQIFGSTSDLEGGAEVWAKRYDRYDPHWERKREAIHQRTSLFPEYRTTEYTIPEQVRVQAQTKYLDQPALCFWAAASPGEGVLGQDPRWFMLGGDVGVNWVQEEKVAIARRRLSERHGRPIGDVLAEIDSRLPQPAPPPPRSAQPESPVVGKGRGGSVVAPPGRGTVADEPLPESLGPAPPPPRRVKVGEVQPPLT